MLPAGNQKLDKPKRFLIYCADIKILLTPALAIVWIFTVSVILHMQNLVSYSQTRWLIIVLPWIAVSLYWVYIYSKKQKIDGYIEEAVETKILAISVIVSIFISNIVVFYAIFIGS